jgi:hypothetical protein
MSQKNLWWPNNSRYPCCSCSSSSSRAAWSQKYMLQELKLRVEWWWWSWRSRCSPTVISSLLLQISPYYGPTTTTNIYRVRVGGAPVARSAWPKL